MRIATRAGTSIAAGPTVTSVTPISALNRSRIAIRRPASGARS